jgi:hypothetical protein
MERVGYLLVAAEEKVLVCVGTVAEQREFCLVWFGQDGSIYVEPRVSAAPGLVSVAGYASEGDKLIDLMKQGRTASHTVKLSHHPDGRVHFSKHGYIPPKVRRESFPLSGTGKIFDLKVFNPAKLNLLTHEKKDRGHIRLRFSGKLPSAVVISGHWVSISEAMEIAVCEKVPCGPMVHASSQNNQKVSCFLLRQPPGNPFRDHLLLLAAHPGEAGPNDEVSVLLIGGHNPGESGVKETGLIASLYPFNPQLREGETMESLDLPVKPAPKP